MLLHLKTGLVALLLGLAGVSVAAAASFPWSKGDAAPPVAGIHLGDSRDRITEILGVPVETGKLGQNQETIRSRARGVTVAWTPSEGASVIFLDTRDGGDIDGIRLGDSRDQVLSKWGVPTNVQAGTAVYLAGAWWVVVKLDDANRVVQLYLGRVVQ